jgi:hypothetical protein
MKLAVEVGQCGQVGQRGGPDCSGHSTCALDVAIMRDLTRGF